MKYTTEQIEENAALLKGELFTEIVEASEMLTQLLTQRGELLDALKEIEEDARLVQSGEMPKSSIQIARTKAHKAIANTESTK